MKFISFPELLGSDSILPVDGRLGRDRIAEIAMDKTRSLRRLGKTVTKFELCIGSIRENRVVFRVDIP